MDFLSSKQVLKILALGICTLQTDLPHYPSLVKELMECIYELVRKKIFMIQVLSIKIHTLDELRKELLHPTHPSLNEEEIILIQDVFSSMNTNNIIAHPYERSQQILDELEQGCQRIHLKQIEDGRELYVKASEEASKDFTQQMKIDMLYDWNKELFQGKIIKEEYRPVLNQLFEEQRIIHANKSYDKMSKRLKKKKVNALANQIKKRYANDMKEICGDKVVWIMNTIEKIFF
jgi:hypothetical protein